MEHRESPSWTRVTVLTGLGLVPGSLAIALAAWPAAWIGLLPSEASVVGLDALWGGGGEWAMLASFGWTALVAGVLAWFVSGTVAAWTEGWKVRVWPVAVAIAIASTGGKDDSTLIALALLVVVVRNVALVPAEQPRPGPSRWDRIVLGAVGLALVLATFSYQPLHPVAASFDGPRIAHRIYTPRPARGDVVTFAFRLRNDGVAALRLRSVRAEWLSLRYQVRIDGSTGGPYRRIPETRLGRDEELEGRVRMLARACQDGPQAETFVWLSVRYEVLGMVRTQYFPLRPPARVKCP